MSGGEVKTRLSKFFMNIINPRKSRTPDAPPPSMESSSSQSTATLPPALADPFDEVSCDSDSDNRTAGVFHGGGEYIEDDYIEDDYCLDYSSSDSEALSSQYSGGSQLSQAVSTQGLTVRMGVSALRRNSDVGTKTTGIFYPPGQNMDMDESKEDVDFDCDSYSDIFPKDLNIEDTIFESASGHTGNVLECMSVSALDAKGEEKSGLTRAESYPSLLRTPDLKTMRTNLEKDIGLYFHLGEPLDNCYPVTPQNVISKSSPNVQHNPLYKTSESARFLKSFNQKVKSSPGFPTSPQKHIYRPSSRRDSGYVSKPGSPAESPEETSREHENFNNKLKKVARQKTYVVSNIFNAPTVGAESGSNLDLVDGIESVKKSPQPKSPSPLRPLVEINEVSPVKRGEVPPATPVVAVTREPKARRSLCVADSAEPLDMTFTKNADTATPEKIKPVYERPNSVVASTPLVKSKHKQATPNSLADEMTEDISPVKCLGKILSKRPDRRGAKRELKKMVSTENSSGDSRPGKRFRKKRPKRDQENIKPSEKGATRSTSFKTPVVSNYILLKRMAEDIVKGIPGFQQLWQNFNLEKLMDYLNEFFRKEIQKINTQSVKTLYSLKKLKRQQAYNESVTIETSKSISTLLYALLLNDDIRVKDCRNFFFKNLKTVAKECPDVYTVAPEILTLLLSNEDVSMVNSQGFPLSYNDAELEVMKVVKSYIEKKLSANQEIGRRVKRVLLSVTDKTALNARNSPLSPVLRRKISLTYSSLQISDAVDEERSPYKKLTNRPYHEIRYEMSRPCLTTPTSRQEYMLQALLSPTTDSPEKKPAGSQDALPMCNSSNLLRKISVSYRQEGDQTRIAGIEMQYSSEEKKRRKRLTLGETMREAQCDSSTASDSGMNSGNASEKSASSLKRRGLVKGKSDVDITVKDSPRVKDASPERGDSDLLKARPFLLRKGEHVTGVNIQGETALENLEFSTSLGRRRCLLASTSSSPWRPLTLPLGGSPHCLQALYAEVNKSSTGQSNFRSLGAVWAVTSRPLNNLNI